MASLLAALPRPQHAKVEIMDAPTKIDEVAVTFEPPPYRQRGSFVPRTAEDFGDGGLPYLN